MNYDLRKATLREGFNVSSALEVGTNEEYALAVMIKLMQDAGFCGSEFHREPVIQLEAVLNKLSGVGAKMVGKLKQELKELKKRLEITENALYEESEWHDHKVRSLPDGPEMLEHDEHARKIRGLINSFDPKFVEIQDPNFHENLLKEKEFKRKWDWGTIEFREEFLSEDDKPYAQLRWLTLPEALKIKFRKEFNELSRKD